MKQAMADVLLVTAGLALMAYGTCLGHKDYLLETGGLRTTGTITRLSKAECDSLFFALVDDLFVCVRPTVSFSPGSGGRLPS